MSRFNNKSTKTVGAKSGVVTTDKKVVRNHQGALAYKRGSKGELFLLAASFMGGDSNFYEKSDDRYARLVGLVNDLDVVADEVWLLDFVNWLRNDAQMRTVAMVVALEAVRARLAQGLTSDGSPEAVSNRDIVSAALSRADEPAEALSYWLSKHGKPIPQPIKNGVADAAVRLYNEFSFLKYGESKSASLTMKDVLRLVHPTPKDPKQDALFEYITSSDRAATLETFRISRKLDTITNRVKMYDQSVENRKQILDYKWGDAFKKAGMTWENVSEWSPEGMTGRVWDAIIPSMGIMALIRNLRNFDEAGISQESYEYIVDKLSSKEEVTRSRQLPFRWYNAYRAVESVRWVSALDTALNYSLENVPALDGQWVVLVDMSGSMFARRLSDKSKTLYSDAASLFGAAIKLRNPDNVDLYQFGSEFDELSGRGQGGRNGLFWTPSYGYVDSKGRKFSEYSESEGWTGVTKRVDIRKGGSVLRAMNKFQDMGGTKLHQAVAETVTAHHHGVIILTDEQNFSYRDTYDSFQIPNSKTGVYIWNLAGYEGAAFQTGKYRRHAFGGLSDAAFRMIPVLESGSNMAWPWSK